jgi:hypothetical protein
MSEFLNSLLSVRKNWKHYPKWEQEQDNKEAQRKELHKKSNYTKEQLEEADKYGRTIIDAVDIMDRYSEDKVEDIEAVLDPLTAISGLAAGSITFILGIPIVNKLGKQIIKDKSKIKSKYYPLLEELENRYVKENGDFAKSVKDFSIRQNLKNFDTKNLIQDPQIKAEVKKILIKYKKEVKPQTAKARILIGSYLGTVVLSFIGVTAASILSSTRMQVQTARIARYQARENELKDPKNFVIYTPEQIQEAKNIALGMPDIKKPKKLSWFSSVKSLFQDRKRYKEWKNIYDKKNENISFENLNLTGEQLKKAKADQDVLFRLIRKVNDTAEDYAESMESTGGFLVTASPLGGAFFGYLISKIPGMTAISEKITRSFFSNSISKGIIKTVIKKFDKKISKDELAKEVSTMAEYFTQFSKKGAFIFISGIGASLIGIPIALKLQKQATRAGRYSAKQELIQDPKNFISYEDEELKQIQDKKAPAKKQGLLHRIREDIKFLPKAIKFNKEYNQHKKIMDKEQLKMRGALNQVELQPGQLENAKDLQRKVFHTFDKVDEMSQKYSENVEAGTNMVLQLFPIAFVGGFIASAVGLISSIYSGTIPVAKVLKHSLNLLSKSTSILKIPMRKSLNLISDGLELEFLKYKKSPNKEKLKTKPSFPHDSRSVSGLIDSLRNYKIGKGIFDLANTTELNRKMSLETLPKGLKLSSLILRDGSANIIDKLNLSPVKLLQTISDDQNLMRLTKQLFPDLNIKEIISELPANRSDLIQILKIFGIDDKLAEDAAKIYNDPTTKINLPDKLLLKIVENYNDYVKNYNIKVDSINKEYFQQSTKNVSFSEVYDNRLMYKETINIKPENINSIEKIFKNGIKSLDENEFKNLIQELFKSDEFLHINKLKKNDIEKILVNLEKIIDNIPKNELNSFLNKMKELSKDEKFKAFITEKSLKDIINSSQPIKKLFFATTAVGMAAVTFMFYLITVYCSELQKRAGRIGTMKAIQSLDDPRYFADIHQKQINTVSEANNNSSSGKNKLVELFRNKYQTANT